MMQLASFFSLFSSIRWLRRIGLTLLLLMASIPSPVFADKYTPSVAGWGKILSQAREISRGKSYMKIRNSRRFFSTFAWGKYASPNGRTIMAKHLEAEILTRKWWKLIILSWWWDLIAGGKAARNIMSFFTKKVAMAPGRYCHLCFRASECQSRSRRCHSTKIPPALAILWFWLAGIGWYPFFPTSRLSWYARQVLTYPRRQGLLRQWPSYPQPRNRFANMARNRTKNAIRVTVEVRFLISIIPP